PRPGRPARRDDQEGALRQGQGATDRGSLAHDQGRAGQGRAEPGAPVSRSLAAATGRLHAMSYQLIEKAGWQSFFDGISRILEGKHVEIEVLGLDLGAQIQVEWLPLNGITYDPKDDALYIYTEGVDRDLDHAIPAPREIYYEVQRGGLVRIVVMNGG